VPGESVEVAIQVAHVDFQMRRGLRAVEQDGDVLTVRQLDDPFNRVDRAERVRNVRDGDHLDALVEHPRELFDQQLAVVVDLDHAQLRPLLFAEHLPRDDVRVVLHRGDDDLVAFVDEFAAVTLRDEVDAFGRAARVNDLVRLGRVYEPLNPDARVFVLARR
jgi:hypothetical protein